jgi:gas vesicle protein
MKTRIVVLSMLGGFTAGAIVGILFAPKKGSKTRRQIIKKGEKYVDEFKSKFEDFSDSVADTYESTKNGAEELASKGMHKYKEVRKEVKHAATDVKNAIASIL